MIKTNKEMMMMMTTMMMITTMFNSGVKIKCASKKERESSSIAQLRVALAVTENSGSEETKGESHLV